MGEPIMLNLPSLKHEFDYQNKGTDQNCSKSTKSSVKTLHVIEDCVTMVTEKQKVSKLHYKVVSIHGPLFG